MRADSEKTLAKYIRCNKYCCHAMTSSTFYWHHFVHQKYPGGQFSPPKKCPIHFGNGTLYTGGKKSEKVQLGEAIPLS